MRKKKVTLTLDPQLYYLAMKEGLSLSAILELTLIRYFYKYHGILVKTKTLEKMIKHYRKVLYD